MNSRGKFSFFIMQYHIMFASLVRRLLAKKKTFIPQLSTQYSNVFPPSPSLSIFQTLNFWRQSHAKFLTESISDLPPLTSFRFKTFSKQTIITKRKSRNRPLSYGIDCTSELSIRWGPRCSMEADDAIDKRLFPFGSLRIALLFTSKHFHVICWLAFKFCA